MMLSSSSTSADQPRSESELIVQLLGLPLAKIIRLPHTHDQTILDAAGDMKLNLGFSLTIFLLTNPSVVPTFPQQPNGLVVTKSRLLHNRGTTVVAFVVRRGPC
jgi:hypothetical protein